MGGKQISGLVVEISDSTSSTIDIGHFFGFHSSSVAANRVQFNNDQLVSQSQLYGFTSDQNLESFSYAAKVEFSIVAPLANLVGTYYKGTVRLGSLFASADLNINSNFTIANLIAVADDIGSMQSSFSLESAVVDDYILTHTLRAGADVVSNVLGDVELGSELVSYIVLQTPVQSIADNTKMTYSLIGNTQSSNLVLASVANLLYYKTFNSVFLGKQHKEIDFQYQGPNSALASMEPPHTQGQLVSQLNNSTTVTAGENKPSTGLWQSVYNYVNDPAIFVPPPIRALAWLFSGKKSNDNLKMVHSSDDEEEIKEDSNISDQDEVPPFIISRKAAAVIAAIKAIKASSLSCLLDNLNHPSLCSVSAPDVFSAADTLRQFSIGVQSRVKGLERVANKMKQTKKLSRKERALTKAVVATKNAVKGNKQPVAMMKAGDNAIITAKKSKKNNRPKTAQKQNTPPINN